MSGHWLVKNRRRSVYQRDRHRCVWCGSPGPLTLDHLRPRSRGGDHCSRNLVTCCLRCNSSRGNRSIRGFALHVAQQTAQDWRAVLLRVQAARRRAA